MMILLNALNSYTKIGILAISRPDHGPQSTQTPTVVNMQVNRGRRFLRELARIYMSRSSDPGLNHARLLNFCSF